jgi:hypothetical protein
MTIKQGEDINKQFSFLNDSIKSINKSFNEYMINNGGRLQKVYNDYNRELNYHRIARSEADSFRVMYSANQKIYMKAEEEYRRLRINSTIFTLAAFFITIVIAGSR